MLPDSRSPAAGKMLPPLEVGAGDTDAFLPLRQECIEKTPFKHDPKSSANVLEETVASLGVLQ